MEAVYIFPDLLHMEASGPSVTLGLFLIFLGLFYWYSVYPFSFFSRCGIKHPAPVPLFGNIFLFRQGFFKPVVDLIKNYGRICGYYLARRPIVMVADPDIIKQVMVKDFSSFPNRMAFNFASKPWTDCLILLRDERWKRVRSVLTPAFSAAKLKEMVPLISTAADTLKNNLKVHAESGEAFDIHRYFGCFTMDVIASVAFGTQVDSQKNPDNPFVRHAQMCFSFSLFRPLLLLFIAFPFIFTPLAEIIPNKKRDQTRHFFSSTIQKIIQQREAQPPEQRRRDFLQLMLEARTSKESLDTMVHSDESIHALASEKDTDSLNPQGSRVRGPQKKTLSDDEIVGQAFVFLLAGYDTTSNTLAFISYLLALHPECQRRVQEEVDEFLTKYDSPDCTNVQELKYMDMVISETLRLYPSLPRIARDIERDCVINGQFLPKGATLEIPVAFLHKDPEHWSEPERFLPERFTPEAKASRHPFVYLPFGAGPRNCVGMRLALLVIKMTLVHLLQRYSIVACSETKVPLELKSTSTLGPKDGVYVKLTRRDVE